MLGTSKHTSFYKDSTINSNREQERIPSRNNRPDKLFNVPSALILFSVKTLHTSDSFFYAY